MKIPGWLSLIATLTLEAEVVRTGEVVLARAREEVVLATGVLRIERRLRQINTRKCVVVLAPNGKL